MLDSAQKIFLLHFFLFHHVSLTFIIIIPYKVHRFFSLPVLFHTSQILLIYLVKMSGPYLAYLLSTAGLGGVGSVGPGAGLAIIGGVVGIRGGDSGDDVGISLPVGHQD